MWDVNLIMYKCFWGLKIDITMVLTLWNQADAKSLNPSLLPAENKECMHMTRQESATLALKGLAQPKSRHDTTLPWWYVWGIMERVRQPMRAIYSYHWGRWWHLGASQASLSAALRWRDETLFMARLTPGTIWDYTYDVGEEYSTMNSDYTC